MTSQATDHRTTRAIRAHQQGQSTRSAAKEHEVPRSTLQRRIAGLPTRSEYNETRQMLSSTQEAFLSAWALTQGQLGYSPPIARFRTYAQRILAASGRQIKLGRKWHLAFLRRHPSLRSMKSKIIDYKRVNGASRENIHLFFDRLSVPQVLAVRPENTFNADEFGLFQGIGENGVVIGASNLKVALTKGPQKRDWMTVIECISAVGKALPPLVVFAAKSVQEQWFPELDGTHFKGWKFDHSDRGWTSNLIALRWFREVFEPLTRPAVRAEWRVLILDGHGSHTTEEFMSECILARVWLVFLPAHSSHVLQPCDLGPFSVVKRRYRKILMDLLARKCLALPSKKESLEAFEIAREEALTEANVKAGFIATGIWPRNRSKPEGSR